MHSTPASALLFQEELYAFTSPLVVILPKQWETYSTEEQSLLQKILTSVKLDLNAIQILAQPSVELKSLLIYSPSRVLVFGSTIREDVPLYSATAAQGFIVIRADDLNALDDQKKKNLWLALRQMFGI